MKLLIPLALFIAIIVWDIYTEPVPPDLLARIERLERLFPVDQQCVGCHERRK